MSSGSENAASGSRDGQEIVAGLLCGLVVGVTLGLLFAPRPGRDNRAWIAEQGRAARRRAGQLIDPTTTWAIIRERGVLGLWKMRRRPALALAVPPNRTPPKA